MSTMLFNPIIGMLFNSKLQRWHPIAYRESPLPGGNGPTRHRSMGHHTEGFSVREEAVTSAKTLAAQIVTQGCSDVPPKLALEEDTQWNGEGIPASVAFFLVDTAKGICRRVM